MCFYSYQNQSTSSWHSVMPEVNSDFKGGHFKGRKNIKSQWNIISFVGYSIGHFVQIWNKYCKFNNTKNVIKFAIFYTILISLIYWFIFQWTLLCFHHKLTQQGLYLKFGINIHTCYCLLEYCKSGNFRVTLIFALLAHFWASAKLKARERVYFVCRSM